MIPSPKRLQDLARIRSRLSRELQTLPDPAWVLSVGKAGVEMARLAQEELQSRGVSSQGLVVGLASEDPGKLEGFEFWPSDHPHPSPRGLAASQRIRQVLLSEELNPGPIWCLISGGASAMLPLPVPGVSLEEKRKTIAQAMAAGASIFELNALRKHLSCLKGGQLARLASPRPLWTLALSDVPGDDLSTIASGPTVPDSTTFSDALSGWDRVLPREKMPRASRAYLEAGLGGERPETPKPEDPLFRGHSARVFLSPKVWLQRCAAELEGLGYEVRILGEALEGDLEEAASQFWKSFGAEVPPGPRAILATGELTLDLGENPGRGGRAQAFAVELLRQKPAFSRPLRGACVGLASDGGDGSSASSGAQVPLEAEVTAPLEEALRTRNTHPYLEKMGWVLPGRSTGTNLSDLYLLWALP